MNTTMICLRAGGKAASLRLSIFLFAVVLATSVAVRGQEGNGKSEESILNNLQFRSIGPANMGGRIDDIAVIENNAPIFYVGAATGGVWKTTNTGTTFEPIFDDAGRVR